LLKFGRNCLNGENRASNGMKCDPEDQMAKKGCRRSRDKAN